jgi:hypothetical protein
VAIEEENIKLAEHALKKEEKNLNKLKKQRKNTELKRNSKSQVGL